LPANPPQNINEINGAQEAKIRGPGDVIIVEVFGGRKWEVAESSDGVLLMLARLRKSVLVRWEAA
jgi:hypothetical protein